MKKMGPSKILCKFPANAYELELPPDIGISLIFNVAYLYPYTASDVNQTSGSVDNNEVAETTMGETNACGKDFRG